MFMSTWECTAGAFQSQYGGAPGVTVADVLRLPDRPALRSPASALLAGELAARGVPVVCGPVSARYLRRQTFVSRVPLVAGAELGDGIGLAIAATRAWLPEVRDVLGHWLSVVAERTVLLAAPRSFCGSHVADSDLVLVIGSADSCDSGRLAELARRCGPPAYLIDTSADIRADWLAGVRTIGLIAAASAPPGLVTTVVDAIAGLGGVRVIERESGTEAIQFALPSLAMSR